MRKNLFPILLYAFAVSLGILFVSLLFLLAFRNAGTDLHPESAGFLYNYTANRPFLNIIFDSETADWGAYQARELSYCFDMLDAKFIILCWKHEVYHCLSLTSIVCLWTILFAILYFSRRLFPSLRRFLPILYAVMFSFSTINTLGGYNFYRSSKQMCAGFVIWTLFLSVHLIRKKFQKCIPEITAILILLSASALLDRQGMFFTASYAACSGLLCCFSSVKNDRRLNLSSLKVFMWFALGITAFFTLYNLFICPQITHSLNHYWPSMWYQNYKNPGSSSVLSSVFYGAVFLFANTGHFFLGIREIYPAAAAGVLLSAVCGWTLVRTEQNKVTPSAFFLSIIAMLLCCSGMYMRHPAILEKGVIFTYYFKIFHALLFFFFLFAVRRLPHKVQYIYLIGLAVLLTVPSFLPSRTRSEKTKSSSAGTVPLSEIYNMCDDPSLDPRTKPMPYRYRLLIERVRTEKGIKIPYSSPGSSD